MCDYYTYYYIGNLVSHSEIHAIWVESETTSRAGGGNFSVFPIISEACEGNPRRISSEADSTPYPSRNCKSYWGTAQCVNPILTWLELATLSDGGLLSCAITGVHLTTSLLGATQATLPAHSMKWDPSNHLARGALRKEAWVNHGLLEI